MPVLLQLVAVVATGAFLCCWRAAMRRRNAQTWDSLVARLRPDWNARALTGSLPDSSPDSPFSAHTSSSANKPARRRICGARALWTIYENTGVMLGMADFLDRNCHSVDPELLAALRREAMQIRVLVLTAFVRCALNAVGETLEISVLRIESAYAEMELGLSELLEATAPEALPSFVAAM